MSPPTEANDHEAATEDVDVWLRVLSSPPRRTIVAHLREHSEASVRDLAKRVAAANRSDRLGGPTPPELDRALTALVHVHLPLLVDAGIVEWDRETGRVTADGDLDPDLEF